MNPNAKLYDGGKTAILNHQIANHYYKRFLYGNILKFLLSASYTAMLILVYKDEATSKLIHDETVYVANIGVINGFWLLDVIILLCIM